MGLLLHIGGDSGKQHIGELLPPVVELVEGGGVAMGLIEVHPIVVQVENLALRAANHLVIIIQESWTWLAG